MTVNALVIGDIHLSGQNLAESLLVIQDIVHEACKYRHILDMVVFLGDITDKFQNVHTSVLRVMVEMIQNIRLSVGQIPIYLIAGNHDRPNNQHYLTNEHPFHGLSEIATVVATEVIEVILKGHKFLFVPYVPDGRFIEAIHDSNKSLENTRTIFAHQTVKNAPLGSCLSDTGDEWDLSYPLVISGHIHGYCVVQPNWHYAGMCWQQHAHDSPDRAILLCHFGDSGDFIDETYVVVNNDICYTRIHLQSLPKKIRVDLTCDELKKYKVPNNVYLHIRLSGTSAEVQTVLKLAKVRALTRLDCVRITINRLHEHDVYFETKSQSFESLISTSIATQYPHLMEHHKHIVELIAK